VKQTLKRVKNMELWLENIKAVVEKKITKGGRIYGLSDYTGYTAKVCIIEDTKKK
jgi:hypothetical protein